MSQHCIIPNCNNKADHNFGLRLRKPDTNIPNPYRNYSLMAKPIGIRRIGRRNDLNLPHDNPKPGKDDEKD